MRAVDAVGRAEAPLRTPAARAVERQPFESSQTAAMRSRQRRCAENKSARCAYRKIARHEKAEESETTWPCLSHRKDQATIRGIARSRRTARETRCRS